MRIVAIAYSSGGCRILLRLKEMFGDDIDIFCKTSSETYGVERIDDNIIRWTGEMFGRYDAMVSVGAIGIAVRHIAPFVKNKCVDPAVIAIDDAGRFVIPILSGHIGGANELAMEIANGLGSVAVITTSTDIHQKFAVDVFAKKNHLTITSMSLAKETSARLIDGRTVGFHSDLQIEGDVPDGLTVADEGEFGIDITYPPREGVFDRSLVLVPKDIVIGVGCKKDTDPKKMASFVDEILKKEGISRYRIKRVSSIVLKSEEPAIIQLSKRYKAELSFYTDEQLNSLEGHFTSSDFVKGVTNVDCVCERSAVYGGGELIMKKTASDGMTVALAKEMIGLRWI